MGVEQSQEQWQCNNKSIILRKLAWRKPFFGIAKTKCHPWVDHLCILLIPFQFFIFQSHMFYYSEGQKQIELEKMNDG